jgi:hypothetical protein
MIYTRQMSRFTRLAGTGPLGNRMPARVNLFPSNLDIAQRIEHQIEHLTVAGSTPVIL